jgi:hypothetical protein
MTAPPVKPQGFKPVFVYADDHGAFHLEVSSPVPITDLEPFDLYTTIQDAAAALFLRCLDQRGGCDAS